MLCIIGITSQTQSQISWSFLSYTLSSVRSALQLPWSAQVRSCMDDESTRRTFQTLGRRSPEDSRTWITSLPIDSGWVSCQGSFSVATMNSDNGCGCAAWSFHIFAWIQALVTRYSICQTRETVAGNERYGDLNVSRSSLLSNLRDVRKPAAVQHPAESNLKPWNKPTR
ncbi:hypothetical protein BJX70DRAFT_352644 [Aspergillus crustosus]